MKKKFRGYISSRKCLNDFIPQKIQNLVIRDFCQNNNLEYLLSYAEYSMNKSYVVLKEMINSIKDVDGIVAFSIFQLPENLKNRTELLKLIISKNKSFFFAYEKIFIRSKKDITKLNEIWMIKKSIENKNKPWLSAKK